MTIKHPTAAIFGLIAIAILCLTGLTFYAQQKRGDTPDSEPPLDSADIAAMNNATGYIWADKKHYGYVWGSIETISEESGLEIVSWADLVKTDYYPFREPLTTTCRGGKINIFTNSAKKQASGSKVFVILDLSSTDFKARFYRTLGEKNYKEMMASQTHVIQYSRDPKLVTKRRLNACVSGTEKTLLRIEEMRTGFLGEMKEVAQICKVKGTLQAWSIKPTVQLPITTAFPRDQKELQLYMKWLCDVEGTDQLEDGWGRDIKLTLGQGKLIGHSRGADGLWGTKDDVVALAS